MRTAASCETRSLDAGEEPMTKIITRYFENAVRGREVRQDLTLIYNVSPKIIELYPLPPHGSSRAGREVCPLAGQTPRTY